jgi:hypothetical protein
MYSELKEGQAIRFSCKKGKLTYITCLFSSYKENITFVTPTKQEVTGNFICILANVDKVQILSDEEGVDLANGFVENQKIIVVIGSVRILCYYCSTEGLYHKIMLNTDQINLENML